MAHYPALTRLILFLLLVALAGCAGIGGRSRLAPTECLDIQDGECVQAEEFKEAAAAAAEEHRAHPGYQNQWGLGYIKADEAYGNVSLLEGADAAPGAGVTIGFMHTGIDLEHPSFAGKTVTETFLDDAVDETGEETSSSGTAFASVAAGGRVEDPDYRDRAHQGVAWGADVAMFAVPTGTLEGAFTPTPVEQLAARDAGDAARYQEMLSWRDGDRKVDILNLSLGFSGVIDGYAEQDLRANYGRTLAALAQADAEEKTILVWAAGSLHELGCDPAVTPDCRYGYLNAVSPHLLAGLAARVEELRPHSVAVVGVRPHDGELGWFSNRCGIAADYCIAAPASRVRYAYFGPFQGQVLRDYGTSSGTGFAAAMVSGGLAIMKQLFRDQLSNTELVARLLRTADRSGIYADRAFYGRGLMDLGAATSPVGILEVPVGASVDQNGVRLLSTALSPGTAFGDGLQRSLASREVMALDRMGAPFWYPLGDLTGAARGPSVSARLRSFLAPDASWPGGEQAARVHGPAAGGGPGAGVEHGHAAGGGPGAGVVHGPAAGGGHGAGVVHGPAAGGGPGAGVEHAHAAGGGPGARVVHAHASGGAAWAPAGVLAYAGPQGSVHGALASGLAGEMTALSLHATRLEASSDVLGSHMSLAEGAVQATLAARGGVTAAAFTTKGLPGHRPTMGAAVGWRRVGSPWGVRAGWIGEPETLLGSVGEGGFGGLAADTSFLGVDAHTHFAGWRIGANAEVGIVVPDARGGFVDRVSSLATSAFALHASRALTGTGAVRFTVSQPLRVERGRASLTVPVRRTQAGAVSYDALTAGLAPSGRQLDFAGEWRRPLPTGELRLGAVYSHRPGHRKDAAPELTLLGGWRWAF